MATLNALRFALAAAAGTACLFINDNTSSPQRSSLISQADARIGRPGTPLSVAGVARRHYRRAAVGAGVVGAGLAAGAYYGGYGTGGYYGTYGGYPGGYYGGYAAGGYPGGYYGAYSAGGYPGGYGAYAAGGYPGGYYGGYANNGVYANRSYVTGRPTLIPRRYGW
jgi:hypothetical protein